MAQIFIDAATRQHPFESSIGYVIRTDDAVLEFGQYVGDMENHEAEWTSLIAALKQAEALAIRSVILKSDSRIVVDSVQKNYTKNPKFKPYLSDYRQLKDKFDLLIIDWIPREQNKHADHVARYYLNKK
ncbi:ribonuclease HI family protein [Macrococcus brunensis]|uniref:ribonuclease HI family protein n=1 Tax=Macrococcus brunensis TaxID=198483 RepID=UPI001EF14288|nr:ribonuclease HI family protein [Macrococcus brunensis]ULG70989.1 ribonuclease HI family protein [Macrococcus brunensis]